MLKIPKEDHLFASIENIYIIDIQISENSRLVKFVVSFDQKGKDSQSFYYFAEADCCSDSWFENFLFDEYIRLPIYVDRIFTLEANYQPKAEKQDYDEILHIVAEWGGASKFRTHRRILFDLRNSSNGYYSGWVSFIGGEAEFLQSHFAVDKPEKQKFKSVIKHE